jgi:hypothetical protein
MAWLLLALHVLANPTVADTVAMSTPHRQVRAVDGRVAAALAEGVRRSPTFARLIATIQRSDVIVYVESLHTLPASISGRMILMANGTRFRYVRVQVSQGLPPDQLISTIAHELQHAVEVAEHPHVRSDAALIELYRRIGAGSSTMFSYDTEAAVRIGAQVRKELGT